MLKSGKDLKFISRIFADGSGTEPVKQELVDRMQDDLFNITRLSITCDTYIASDMSTFVVEFKK